MSKKKKKLNLARTLMVSTFFVKPSWSEINE